MSKSYWLKDEDQKGNFSNEGQDTFDPQKGYTGVRLQQGVPLLDRDWNELEDIRRYSELMLRRHYIGSGSPDNGFKIRALSTPGNDFIISKGRCMVMGVEVVNETDIKYSQQVGAPPLEVPNGNKNYIVYIDAWIQEVTSAEDPDLGNSDDVKMETCIRHKLNWRVKVRGEGPIPIPAHHFLYDIARIRRKANKSKIENSDIDDLREAPLSLAKLVQSLTNNVNADAKHRHSKLVAPDGSPDPALMVDNSGNVGIGTKAPKTKFHVISPLYVGWFDSTTNDACLLLYTSEGFENRLAFCNRSGGRAAIYVAGKDVGDAFNVLRNGSVGIGTATPGEKLEVAGGVNIFKKADKSNAGSISIGREAGTENYWSIVHRAIEADADKFMIFRRDPSGWKGPYFTITPDGKFGIGTKNPAQLLHVNGKLYVRNWQTVGSDYAEYFESKSGKVIPVGTAVVLENGKVRQAKKNETPLGIISANPGGVSGVHVEWPKKYLRNEFGSQIMEEYKEEIMVPKKEKIKKERQKVKKKKVKEKVKRTEIVQKKGKYCQVEIEETIEKEVEEPVFKEVDLYDDSGKNKIGKHQVPIMETYEEEIDVLDENGQPVMIGSGKFETKTRPKINPEYDEKQEYIPREKRPEWNCVGLLGQLPLRKGQPTAPSWIKIKDISKDVELWLVK